MDFTLARDLFVLLPGAVVLIATIGVLRGTLRR